MLRNRGSVITITAGACLDTAAGTITAGARLDTAAGTITAGDRLDTDAGTIKNYRQRREERGTTTASISTALPATIISSTTTGAS